MAGSLILISSWKSGDLCKYQTLNWVIDTNSVVYYLMLKTKSFELKYLEGRQYTDYPKGLKLPFLITKDWKNFQYAFTVHKKWKRQPSPHTGTPNCSPRVMNSSQGGDCHNPQPAGRDSHPTISLPSTATKTINMLRPDSTLLRNYFQDQILPIGN